MLVLYETYVFESPIVPVRVTKLRTTFFMFTKVPSTYLDQWLALSINFPREYTCSLTTLPEHSSLRIERGWGSKHTEEVNLY